MNCKNCRHTIVESNGLLHHISERVYYNDDGSIDYRYCDEAVCGESCACSNIEPERE